MRIVFALILIMLLFGCNGGRVPVGDNQTNGTDGSKPVTIIVGEQKNQTTEQNVTPPEPPNETVKKVKYEYAPNKSIGIFFIYVGDSALHGDAILIKKGDLDILVDAGSAQKAGTVVDFLRSKSVDDIEVLVSTNADPRHYGGIDLVAQNFDIESLWWTGETFDDMAYENTIDNVKSEVILVNVVEDGFSEELNGIRFSALNPPKTNKFEDFNNEAIVLRLKDRNFSIMLTSGIQTGAQGRLINKEPEEIQTKLIQAPYYGVGSGTSNIAIFLLRTKPDAMIISGSADESPANGGSRDPFKRIMTQYGIKWYENYKNGTLRVSSDGQTYDIAPAGS